MIPLVAQNIQDRTKVDLELVSRARDYGDEKAYNALMRRYREPVYYMLYRMLGDHEDANDLTAVAFSKAFIALQDYTPTNTFSTWLFSIASRVGIDFIRRRKNANTVSLDTLIKPSGVEEGGYELSIPDDDDNPEEAIIREQRYAILRRVVGQLKPEYRRMVELRYFEDKNYEEIARELDMPLGTVKTHLYRAHDLLRELIKLQKEF